MTTGLPRPIRPRLPGTVAEIEGSPKGPEVAAFFDLDGTLVYGMTGDYMRRDKEFGKFDLMQLVRSVGILAVGAGLTPTVFDDLLTLTGEQWVGKTEEEFEEMGRRIFKKYVADLMYPEMKRLVRAHQRQGHTVVLTTSATQFQAQPVADYLGVENVLCSRFLAVDGVLTGEVVRPGMWGPGKARAAQAFASAHGIDMADSYFYADGNEDAALMMLVGHPRPTNPQPRLTQIAKRRGWPMLNFESRGRASALRGIAAFGALVPIAAAGVGYGLLSGDKRAGINFIIKTWLPLQLSLNNVKIEVTGRAHLEAVRPAVFIFNHRNNFDPFIVAHLVGSDFTGIAKSELKSDPVMGTVGRLGHLVFIDRSNSASAVATLKELGDLREKGLSMLISPEGHRFDTEEVGDFKKGAFRVAMASKMPIVPIVVHDAEVIAGQNAIHMNPGTVHVTVLPPISVAKWRLADLPERIQEVRQLYLDTLEAGYDG